MTQIVSAFQLGTSTVITLPKSLGIKPGTKLEIKKSKNGATLKMDKKKTLLEILEETRGAWADMDWKEYNKKEKARRKFEIEAAKRMKKA